MHYVSLLPLDCVVLFCYRRVLLRQHVAQMRRHSKQVQEELVCIV